MSVRKGTTSRSYALFRASLTGDFDHRYRCYVNQQASGWVLDLVELEPGDPRLIDDALPVLRELRTHLTSAAFSQVCEQGFKQGLRFWAVYHGHRCVGVCGWRPIHNTSAGRKLYIDDLVTTEDLRGQGVGSYFLSRLAGRAREEGCSILDLDSGTQRKDAHRFYLREGLSNTALHFGREIT